VGECLDYFLTPETSDGQGFAHSTITVS